MERVDKKEYFTMNGDFFYTLPNNTVYKENKSIYKGLLNIVFARSYLILDNLKTISFRKDSKDENVFFFKENSLNELYELYHEYGDYIHEAQH